jgi:hypothetical protein
MHTVFFITAAILLLGSSCVSGVSFKRHLFEWQISAFKWGAEMTECEDDFIPVNDMNAKGGVQI